MYIKWQLGEELISDGEHKFSEQQLKRMDHDTTTMSSGSTTTVAPSGVCIPKMDMSLHWGTCEWILARAWKADTNGKFWFATIMIFLATIAYEGLKYYRELLYYKSQQPQFIKQSDGTVVKRERKMTMKVSFSEHIPFQSFNSFNLLGTTLELAPRCANVSARNSNFHLVHAHADRHVGQYVHHNRRLLGSCHRLFSLLLDAEDKH